MKKKNILEPKCVQSIRRLTIKIKINYEKKAHNNEEEKRRINKSFCCLVQRIQRHVKNYSVEVDSREHMAERCRNKILEKTKQSRKIKKAYFFQPKKRNMQKECHRNVLDAEEISDNNNAQR